MSEPLATEGTPGPRTLTRHQRRVLGVLVEKAITTPNQYPLTLKSVTTGCNQTSNRDPVVNYTEEQCQQYLDELRALGLVACIHTESGRTERFRHYIRKAYPFTEPQLAIMTELWLRGRQQPGELRTRASRMAPLDSQEQLRAELTSLMEQGFVQADGPLDRRGVLVDHGFYPPHEVQRMERRTAESTESPGDDEPAAAAMPSRPAVSAANTNGLAAEVARISAGQEALLAEIDELRGKLNSVTDELAALRRSLGA
ncbi:MAG: DUF480 domain-containing protein [Planctomycetaceae bacterium]